MIVQVFKSNAAEHADAVLTAGAFEAEVFFPKIRNLNRLDPQHRRLALARTEKFDGQNIGAQRRGDRLVFYSRNGLLDLSSLGKGIQRAWAAADWAGVHAALEEGDTLYVEAVGNHRDFDYRADFPPDGQGLIAFALRRAGGALLDPTRLPALPMACVRAQEVGPAPDLQALRRLLDAGREGYVFTGYGPAGEYIAYKAKRRELLEEAVDEERASILAGGGTAAEKIAKVACTVAKVKHVLQKLADEGRWDGSNAVIPVLIKAVQDDCWAESGDAIRELSASLGASGKQVNRALEERVRAAFFELTLRESLEAGAGAGDERDR